MSQERCQEHAGGDQRREERGNERVLCGGSESPATEIRSSRTRHERVRDETECDEERGTTELSHGGPSVGTRHDGSPLFFGAYLDGHLVIIDPGSATKTPPRRRPTTTI